VAEVPAPHYVALTFDVAASVAEIWADALLEAGAESVDAADARAGTESESPAYGDPEGYPWPVVRLTALFGEGEPWPQMLAEAQAMAGEPAPPYATQLVESGGWVGRTRAQFTPIRVTERLWIVPTWCAPPDPDAVVVTLDPGLAFGTGTHPTTQLCLRWLAEHLRAGDTILDYGCGSGILAIAAAKLGAGRVTGVDIDPQAIATSRANAKANAVEISFGLPHELGDETFDVVVANILANPLEILAPLLAARARVGGHIVLSGILEAHADAVLDAYGRWFNIGPWGSTDGWVALAGVARAAP
jgi:ribosomal protein L11 methyltransferase